jgi:thiol-disulfide isomerase/thioredoxin
VNPEIISRLIWTIAITGSGVTAYWLYNRLTLSRLAKAQVNQPGLENFDTGRPGILYFTNPDCVPCKTVQRPELERLKTQLNGVGLQIMEVDCHERPDVATEWGILSVPTTFIIDQTGRPRRVNHGVTRKEKLAEQIQAVTTH